MTMETQNTHLTYTNYALEKQTKKATNFNCSSYYVYLLNISNHLLSPIICTNVINCEFKRNCKLFLWKRTSEREREIYRLEKKANDFVFESIFLKKRSVSEKLTKNDALANVNTVANYFFFHCFLCRNNDHLLFWTIHKIVLFAFALTLFFYHFIAAVVGFSSALCYCCCCCFCCTKLRIYCC